MSNSLTITHEIAHTMGLNHDHETDEYLIMSPIIKLRKGSETPAWSNLSKVDLEAFIYSDNSRCLLKKVKQKERASEEQGFIARNTV